MFYKGYEIVASCLNNNAGIGLEGCESNCENCGIIVDGIKDFDPKHIFECGQCFRWNRETDGSYTGVVRGKVANVSYIMGRLFLKNVTQEDFKRIWFDYFDLGRDYSRIKKAVSIDPIMKEAVKFGNGIRILRQEPWEALISFILSSNNRIPRIMKIVSELSRLYGLELRLSDKTYYSFPEAQSLAVCSLEQIQECRAGYRCEYIHETAAAVASKRFELESLAGMEAEEARNELLRLKGVGTKVADCFLLYSGTRIDVFPTDVWVKRVMEELYFGREASFKEIQQFAAEKFGKYAGVAQQYLFYYAREHKIGIAK